MLSPRVLLLLGQMPHDPASGAAHSMRTICEFLAGAGLPVAAISTTAMETRDGPEPIEYLRSIAKDPQIDRASMKPGAAGGSGEVIRFCAAGVRYVMLNTGRLPLYRWERPWGARFDQLLDECLREFRPDIVFTYGGTPPEKARRRRIRQSGCKVVFGLRNLGYLSPGAFENVDAVLTGSRFITDRYRKVTGIESTPLPLPIDWSEVVPAAHEKIFVTYINPSVEKGVFFAARLFEELSLRRPDVPILVVESRGTAGMLVAAGLKGGFDLRRHENLMTGKTVARPADIFALARVLIAPSVWEEPAGRVAAEALANGIPPVVSDRGGLAEVCGAGGFVLPLPGDLTTRTRIPVPKETVRPWMELLLKLADDEPFYQQACARATAAGAAFRQESLAQRYVEFFQQVHGAGRTRQE